VKRGRRWVVAVLAATVAVLALSAIALGRIGNTDRAQVTIPAFTATDMQREAKDDWIVPGGNLQGWNRSSLTQITTSNVSKLAQTWRAKLTAPEAGDPLTSLGGEAQPIAYKGALYTMDQVGRVFANDATNGNQLWYYEPRQSADPVITKGINIVAATRGVAIGGGAVYVAEPSAFVAALDPNPGKQLWVTQIASVEKGQSLSSAPIYYDGKIIMATSGGDRGASCIVFALDAKTGKALWHFNIIPASAKQAGWETWSHPLAFNGGGAVWASVSIDPQLGQAYISAGNPIPYSALLRGPGKEYFTNGIIALDLKTGKQKWFYQVVHHDLWDADQAQRPILFDWKYKGTVRKAMYFANKDGLQYIIDRSTGKPTIIPVKEVPVQQSKEANSWPTQPISAGDPTGPSSVPDPKAWEGILAPDGKPFNLGPGGAAGRFTAIDSSRYSVTAAFGTGPDGSRPAAYDPQLGLVFNEEKPGFSAFQSLPVSEIKMTLGKQTFNQLRSAPLAATPAAALAQNRLSATDVRTNKLKWTVDHANSANVAGQPSNAFTGGVMSTQGIVWAQSSNKLQAYDAKDASLLWSSPTLSGAPRGVPITYTAGGKQYVATFVANTGDLYVFGL
jgi:quinohemoprotein ethanol dehydrogenase